MNHFNQSILEETLIKLLNNKLPEEQFEPSCIFSDMEQFIRKTFYAHEDDIKQLTSWIYGTYFYQQFKSGFPYLLIEGEKGSGKTTLTEIVRMLSFAPWSNTNLTPAAQKYIIEQGIRGTLFVDELESTIFNKDSSNDIAKLLKAGYSSSDYDIKYDADTGMKKFSTFGPKVISVKLPENIKARCIEFTCIREPLEWEGELEDIFDYRDGEKKRDIDALTSRAAFSALIHSGKLAEIVKTISNEYEVNNFETRNQLPLAAIAILAGQTNIDNLK